VYPKVSGLSRNEIYVYNKKHSLRSNTKSYGGKTLYTDSQNSDTSAHSGTELYHLQFSLQAVSPGTFRYTLVPVIHPVNRAKVLSEFRHNTVVTYKAKDENVKGSKRRRF
jgi:hypothetical protein